jgi:parvulin-like peptidyl-prolyl isomerase
MRLFLILLLPFFAWADSSMSLPPTTSQQLVVNNRILVKINDKTISVLDVMKTMDIHLNRYYPELVDSPIARYQFYTSNWRFSLDQMIIAELMMADAEKREIKVSDGEVREEIQSRFGPNVMASLEKIGISYEEAREKVHEDMVRQRMEWFRVTSKAFNKVTLKEVKEAYTAKYQPSEQWKYQTLSIRSKEKETCKLLANKIFALIQEEHLDLKSASEKLQDEHHLEEGVALNLSPEYQEETKKLSSSHRDILSCLNVGAVSPPVEQTSKDQSIVYRLFYLQDHIKKDPPPFEEVARGLKDDLVQEAHNEVLAVYIAKLHKQFGYDEKSLDIPNNFVPFTLTNP